MLDKTPQSALAHERFPWTEEQVAFASDLGGQGYSAGYIAKVMSERFATISRNAVIGKLHRMGVTFGTVADGAAASQRRRARKGSQTGFTHKHRVLRIKRAAEPPVEELPEEPVAPGFLNIAFGDLQHGQCRFPRGDNPFFFCGQKAKPGSSYCQSHHDLCWRQPPKSVSAEERRERRRLAKQVHGVMGRAFG